jgi:asparagine synthase (glutamine-hydrolysing)
VNPQRPSYNAQMHRAIDRVVDLLDPRSNQLYGINADAARQRIRSGDAAAVRAIDGSFALVAVDGTTVRMARSLDRPMRYFLAKRHEGPALFVADRIDTLQRALTDAHLDDQFHPSYTRMVPAHHLVELALVGCPDPGPTYTRFFTPARGSLAPDLDSIGRAYIGALANEIAKWLTAVDRDGNGREPIGVSFSGGIDSGSVFLVIYHTMQKLGLSPARLKAFVLDLGDGPDVAQAREFLDAVGLTMFLEPIAGANDDLDVDRALRVLEDYKSLDVECAAMGLALCRGIRERYPDWRHLADGDGGDENLKDYPIEENPELTIRSVVDNLMLYQEGWGVGRLKHSLTYTGGLSRSYVRTYAPAAKYGFAGFSPYTRPDVIEVAEAIPFAALTHYDVPTLYALKGEIVRRGVKAITGVDMPVFPKRRFQHGAVPVDTMRQRLGHSDRDYRRAFERLYA